MVKSQQIVPKCQENENVIFFHITRTKYQNTQKLFNGSFQKITLSDWTPFVFDKVIFCILDSKISWIQHITYVNKYQKLLE